MGTLCLVGGMKNYSKDMDNRSWGIKPNERREYILKHPFYDVLYRPIPLPLLHKTLKLIYCNRSISCKKCKNKRKKKNLSIFNIKKGSPYELQNEIERFEFLYKMRNSYKNARVHEEPNILHLTLPTTPQKEPEPVKVNDEIIRKSIPKKKLKSRKNRISSKDVLDVSEAVSLRNIATQVKLEEQPIYKEITEIFMKETLNKLSENDVKTDEPEIIVATENDQPSEEDEEIFLDAITFFPEDNETSHPSYSELSPPLDPSEHKEFDRSGSNVQPPDGDDPPDDGGGDHFDELPFLAVEKTRKCETCEFYLFKCCKYECTLDNLCTFSSALECRCKDYEKMLRLYCTKLTASRIIIKHLQEKNNQLLQKINIHEKRSLHKVGPCHPIKGKVSDIKRGDAKKVMRHKTPLKKSTDLFKEEISEEELDKLRKDSDEIRELLKLEDSESLKKEKDISSDVDNLTELSIKEQEELLRKSITEKESLEDLISKTEPWKDEITEEDMDKLRKDADEIRELLKSEDRSLSKDLLKVEREEKISTSAEDLESLKKEEELTESFIETQELLPATFVEKSITEEEFLEDLSSKNLDEELDKLKKDADEVKELLKSVEDLEFLKEEDTLSESDLDKRTESFIKKQEELLPTKDVKKSIIEKDYLEDIISGKIEPWKEEITDEELDKLKKDADEVRELLKSGEDLEFVKKEEDILSDLDKIKGSLIETKELSQITDVEKLLTEKEYELKDSTSEEKIILEKSEVALPVEETFEETDKVKEEILEEEEEKIQIPDVLKIIDEEKEKVILEEHKDIDVKQSLGMESEILRTDQLLIPQELPEKQDIDRELPTKVASNPEELFVIIKEEMKEKDVTALEPPVSDSELDKVENVDTYITPQLLDAEIFPEVEKMVEGFGVDDQQKPDIRLEGDSKKLELEPVTDTTDEIEAEIKKEQEEKAVSDKPVTEFEKIEGIKADYETTIPETLDAKVSDVPEFGVDETDKLVKTGPEALTSEILSGTDTKLEESKAELSPQLERMDDLIAVSSGPEAEAIIESVGTKDLSPETITDITDHIGAGIKEEKILSSEVETLAETKASEPVSDILKSLSAEMKSPDQKPLVVTPTVFEPTVKVEELAADKMDSIVDQLEVELPHVSTVDTNQVKRDSDLLKTPVPETLVVDIISEDIVIAVIPEYTEKPTIDEEKVTLAETVSDKVIKQEMITEERDSIKEALSLKEELETDQTAAQEVIIETPEKTPEFIEVQLKDEEETPYVERVPAKLTEEVVITEEVSVVKEDEIFEKVLTPDTVKEVSEAHELELKDEKKSKPDYLESIKDANKVKPEETKQLEIKDKKSDVKEVERDVREIIMEGPLRMSLDVTQKIKPEIIPQKFSIDTERKTFTKKQEINKDDKNIVELFEESVGSKIKTDDKEELKEGKYDTKLGEVKKSDDLTSSDEQFPTHAISDHPDEKLEENVKIEENKIVDSDFGLEFGKQLLQTIGAKEKDELVDEILSDKEEKEELEESLTGEEVKRMSEESFTGKEEKEVLKELPIDEEEKQPEEEAKIGKEEMGVSEESPVAEKEKEVLEEFIISKTDNKVETERKVNKEEGDKGQEEALNLLFEGPVEQTEQVLEKANGRTPEKHSEEDDTQVSVFTEGDIQQETVGDEPVVSEKGDVLGSGDEIPEDDAYRQEVPLKEKDEEKKRCLCKKQGKKLPDSEDIQKPYKKGYRRSFDPHKPQKLNLLDKYKQYGIKILNLDELFTLHEEVIKRVCEIIGDGSDDRDSEIGEEVKKLSFEELALLHDEISVTGKDKYLRKNPRLKYSIAGLQLLSRQINKTSRKCFCKPSVNSRCLCKQTASLTPSINLRCLCKQTASLTPSVNSRCLCKQTASLTPVNSRCLCKQTASSTPSVISKCLCKFTASLTPSVNLRCMCKQTASLTPSVNSRCMCKQTASLTPSVISKCLCKFTASLTPINSRCICKLTASLTNVPKFADHSK